MTNVRTIWFETHATSLDNEAGLASGRFDADLSAAGVEQAVELGRRYAGTGF
jgi:broad specificity phosphatase PhoE